MPKNKAHIDLLIFTTGAIIGLVGIYFFIKKFSVKRKAVDLAIKEWEDWGKQTVNIFNKVENEGSKEFEDGYSERVNDYWRDGVGMDYDGKDREVAWSSAFISWLWKKAGAGDRFLYNASHSYYIYDSVKNRWDKKTNAPFVAYQTWEVVPEVGDMVSYSRQSQTDMYSSPAPYKSHSDLVVKKGKGYIDVIGGNVAQGVTKRRLRTDSKGFLMDTKSKWFAIIKSNI